jgi:hypothetical protein
MMVFTNNSKRCIFLILFSFSMLRILFSINFVSLNQVKGSDSGIILWANDGGDKVTKDELRASIDPESVLNSVWNGSEIALFGARNEAVSFNLVLESPNSGVSGVEVTLNVLEGPDGSKIATRAASGDDLFNFGGRNIELFYVRYLEIEGLSTNLAFAGIDYDERHIPTRFQLPYNEDYEGVGVWKDRPDHNKMYPEIAVPIELESPISISEGTSQSIWCDIYIPKDTPPGDYIGTISILIDGEEEQEVPVNLNVREFTLPDYPSAKTMLAYSTENINNRYLGDEYPYPGSDAYEQSIELQNRHFQLVHRHKISLIDDWDFDVTSGRSNVDLVNAWLSRLNGELFTTEYGYSGVGEGVGNNVFSIGIYGSWHWQDSSEEDMWENTDSWANWFEDQDFSTPTEVFLYLIDESDEFSKIERWANWMETNPGIGKNVMSMATIPLTDAVRHTPSLDIPTSEGTFGITERWEEALQTHRAKPSTRFYMYNGQRPATGSFSTEDDGVSLRVLAWGQYKMNVDRWFYWESTYYNNYQGDMGHTNVFQKAQTYGSYEQNDKVLGKTGWNYFNGDGVLLYPGTDLLFDEDNYNVQGPFASLRLKHWRRGLQDVDYLTLAAEVDSLRTSRIVEKMIPVMLWEVGCEIYQGECDGWIQADISWPTDPDDWEEARAELADIIEGKVTTDEPEPQPESEPEDEPETELEEEVEEEQEDTNIMIYGAALLLLVMVSLYVIIGRRNAS